MWLLSKYLLTVSWLHLLLCPDCHHDELGDQLTRGKVDREVCTFVTDVLVARATREISEKGFRLKILKGYLLSYQLRDNRH